MTRATTDARDIALAVRGIEVGYGRGPSVVAGVDLDVPRGACVGLVGANGAGKSSIMRCIAGLMRPRSGRIELNGRNVAGRSSWALASHGLRMVPETRELFTSLSVDLNLRLGATSLPPRRRAEQIARARSLFPPLERLADRRAGALSGGEQEMLVVARAVAGAPDVIVMDEPTLGLAPTAVARLEAGLRRLLEDGVTMLIAEQNLGLVQALAEHVVAIQLGHVVASGTPAELFDTGGLRRMFLGAGA